MFVAHVLKLSNLGHIEPLMMYNIIVSFVNDYDYLGVIVDYINHIKKLVYVKNICFV